MKINEVLSDKAILREIGKRLQNLRISENITQSQLAQKTGVSMSTIARMEQGSSVKTDSLVRVMRELNVLENLDTAFLQQEVRPMDLINMSEKKRKRASKQKVEETTNDWKWGDEK